MEILTRKCTWKKSLLLLLVIVWVLLWLTDFHWNKALSSLGGGSNVPHPLSVCRNTTRSSNFTVVTAMLDIGRGQWQHSDRTYDRYLRHFHFILRLNVNMIIFADRKAARTARRMRDENCGRKTRVIEVTLMDLPYARLLGRFRDVMALEEYRRDNPLVEGGNPEAVSAEYDVVMLSKAYMLDLATRRNPFNNSYFIWLDGGYGHGQSGIFPRDGEWEPKHLLDHPEKVTLIERAPGVEKFRDVDDLRLHKLSVNILVGGFTGGGTRALRRLYALQQEVVREWLQRGMVDDDQSSYMTMYFREPLLFRLVAGDWWDVFKLFS